MVLDRKKKVEEVGDRTHLRVDNEKAFEIERVENLGGWEEEVKLEEVKLRVLEQNLELLELRGAVFSLLVLRILLLIQGGVFLYFFLQFRGFCLEFFLIQPSPDTPL